MSRTETLKVRVSAMRALTPNVREFEFARADGDDFPPYSAGSHVIVTVPDGPRLRRNPYSLLGDPAERGRWRIAVQRQAASRGGSAWLCTHGHVGLMLEISQPANLFALVRTAHRHLLVAGGIGITPILAQARELARMGCDFEVHYGYRSEAEAALADELQAIAQQRLSRYDASRGETIRFERLLAVRPLGTHLYICGPNAMVAACMAAGAELGWPKNHLHSERFVAAAGGEPFEVKLARSGKCFTVAGDVSLLEAIEQQGVEAASLCRGGACGQCEVAVLAADGRLVHNDVYLSDEERAAGRKILPCVSRLEGRRLVLDC